MRTEEIIQSMIKAIDKQSKSERSPPYIFILNSRECSWNDFSQTRKRLSSLGYKVKITQTPYQYEVYATPKTSR
jgi:dTDP-4-dehydrorhamnose reductase